MDMDMTWAPDILVTKEEAAAFVELLDELPCTWEAYPVGHFSSPEVQWHNAIRLIWLTTPQLATALDTILRVVEAAHQPPKSHKLQSAGPLGGLIVELVWPTGWTDR